MIQTGADLKSLSCNFPWHQRIPVLLQSGMGGQLMSPAQLQHLRNMIMTCMSRYPYRCTNWHSHFGRNQQLLVWLKTYSQEGNWVWFWKFSQLPAPNEVKVLGKDSTLVTLPNEYNSLLSSKSYPYTHI